MKEVTIETVLTILNSMDNIEITKGQLEDDLTECGMDSITFIQTIVALEDEFDCEIPDSKLMLREMNTIRKIIDVLQALYNESIVESKAL